MLLKDGLAERVSTEGESSPADILMAADDPVIPLRDFHELRPGGAARLELAGYGGHCGFLENRRFDGYAERWVAQRLAA